MDKKLHLKLPPLALVIVIASLMYFIDVKSDVGYIEYSFLLYFACLFAFVGGVIIVLSKIEFDRAKTTVNPMRPENVSQLVNKGFYRFSRNPMYLGFLLMLFAWGMVLGNFLCFFLLPFYIWFITRYQIKPEENVLRTKFGNDYERYYRKVRRWI